MQPYSAQRYRAMLTSLLPTGPAWTGELEALLSKLVDACAQELARIDAAMHGLVAELDPQQTAALMPEWERVAGLPDACSGASDTTAERRAQVLFKLAATGGQRPDYFEEIAFIYTMMECEVREFQPFCAGSAAGDSLTNGDWAFAWELHAPENVRRDFRAGQSVAGEPLRTWGNETLECIINRLKPAHTHVIFTYEEA